MAQTSFIEVISNYAMLEIADIRLQKELAESPARFFRKMSFYMLNAIPRFNRPPEAHEWLSFSPPVYDDMEYMVPSDYSGGDLTIETNKTGFEMANIIHVKPDGYGSYEYIPVACAYDAETGNITIADGIVSANDQLSLDFYTDGIFDRELGYTMKRILGLLVQLVWENRFINDFLLQQPKIKDRSFDVGNEANHMRAATERLRFLNDQVNQELKSFEQGLCYESMVKNKGQYTDPTQQSTWIGPDYPTNQFPNLWVDTDENP